MDKYVLFLLTCKPATRNLLPRVHHHHEGHPEEDGVGEPGRQQGIELARIAERLGEFLRGEVGKRHEKPGTPTERFRITDIRAYMSEYRTETDT